MGAATEMKALPGGLARFLVEHQPQVVNLVFGVLIAVLLIFEPGGLTGAYRTLVRRLSRPGSGA